MTNYFWPMFKEAITLIILGILAILIFGFVLESIDAGRIIFFTPCPSGFFGCWDGAMMLLLGIIFFFLYIPIVIWRLIKKHGELKQEKSSSNISEPVNNHKTIFIELIYWVFISLFAWLSIGAFRGGDELLSVIGFGEIIAVSAYFFHKIKPKLFHTILFLIVIVLLFLGIYLGAFEFIDRLF